MLKFVRLFCAKCIICNNLKSKDPFLKNIANIAEKNNLQEDSVIAIIQTDHELLKELKSGYKIFNELEEHITAVNKYSEFLNANAHLTKFYLDHTINIVQTHFEEKFVNEELEIATRHKLG